MNRLVGAGVCAIALMAPSFFTGCVYEDTTKARFLQITGKVTYNGAPVKKGLIHFLPFTAGSPPATGSIADGEIIEVHTHVQGDGIPTGRYKIAITSFDEEFLKSVAKRDERGPDPIEVARAANNVKHLIPARYSNYRESGLTADFSPMNLTIHLDLVD